MNNHASNNNQTVFHKIESGRKGFTLIELLVVIAIIAVLSVVVILTLNPAELLRQARDSSRTSDMSTLKNAVLVYVSDLSSATLDGGGGLTCWTTTATSTAACQVPFVTATGWNASSSRAIDGTGWLPVNFNLVSVGAPISILPADPINDSTYFYAYIARQSSGKFKLAATMESISYRIGGSYDAVSKDGGNSDLWYESGSDLSL